MPKDVMWTRSICLPTPLNNGITSLLLLLLLLLPLSAQRNQQLIDN